MNKSIFGITLVVMLSYGQMSWAGDPAACISGFTTDGSSPQINLFMPRRYLAKSKASISMNGIDITKELCEFMALDDGIQEIRCKIHFSQHPIAHIAGSPNDFFDVRYRFDTNSDPSQLTAGCTHRNQDLLGIVPGSSSAGIGVDGYGNFGGGYRVSCTPSDITMIVSCPPPVTPATANENTVEVKMLIKLPMDPP